LDLAPGHYQVRIAGRATRTGTTGLVTVDVDVPRFERERVSMSGITMTSLPSVLMITDGNARLSATLKTPPSAARAFVAGDQITAAVEVYVPGSAAAADVVAWVEGPDGSRKMSLDTNGTATRDRPAVAFPIETTSLAAGHYMLHVVLKSSDGPADAEHRRVPFEISAAPQRE